MRSHDLIAKYVKHAVSLGASGAKKITTGTIITASWVRMKCQYGCSGFGQCLTCPPYSLRPEETAHMLHDYRTALLIHGTDHTDVTKVAVFIERVAFLDGFYKAFAFGSGPCRLCGKCSRKPGTCANPERARPSMEACGIDVFQTARKNGFTIEVVKNRKSRQNYFAVVLLE